jgi:hypothetical protein
VFVGRKIVRSLVGAVTAVSAAAFVFLVVVMIHVPQL